MKFTYGKDRAFEMLMQQAPGFDRYESPCASEYKGCGDCRFYRPHWNYQFCVYAVCPYEPGKPTAKRKTENQK